MNAVMARNPTIRRAIEQARRDRYAPGLLHQIADDGCRYIPGTDGVMCGAKAGDSPWCENHRHGLYQGGAGP